MLGSCGRIRAIESRWIGAYFDSNFPIVLRRCRACPMFAIKSLSKACFPFASRVGDVPRKFRTEEPQRRLVSWAYLIVRRLGSEKDKRDQSVSLQWWRIRRVNDGVDVNDGVNDGMVVVESRKAQTSERLV